MCNSVFYHKNTPTIGRNRQLPAKNKMSNNSEMVRDPRNMLMNHDYETGVSLSDFANKTCVKRQLAEKSRWRHFRLAIKPRYLGNHASQIKSYFGSLSGSQARSFRIRHENSLEAPPSGEITITSYPACNKTSLSRKPCILDKKLLLLLLWLYSDSKYNSRQRYEHSISNYGTLSGSYGRSFRIRHQKSREHNVT